jgi:outer membrane protein assembly factor BamB
MLASPDLCRTNAQYPRDRDTVYIEGMQLRALYRWFLVAVAGALVIGIELWLRHVRPFPTPKTPAGPEVLWTFETAWPGSIISSPTVDGDRIYVGVIRDAGLSPRGVVYALDRLSGKAVWSFDDDEKMLHMYSSPRVVGNRLYIGEGMHANFKCHLYCLDIRTGAMEWTFPVDGHIESTPGFAEGRVVFGAGDDGLWAVDAVHGTKLWRHGDGLHVDSNPEIVGSRVYAGSGVSRRFQAPAVFCVDLENGREVWRTPTDLPAWGSPAVDNDRLYIGLGNGRLDRSSESPAGAVLCLDARSGNRIWRQPMPDVVMSQPAVADKRIFVTCRDGACYALAREDGHVLWQTSLGSALVTVPKLVDGKMYLIASGGIVAALNPETGAEMWRFDVSAHAKTEVKLFSSPAVVADGNGHNVLYFGVELLTPGGRAGSVYALRD